MVQAWTIPKSNGKSKKRCASPGPGNYNQVDLNLVRVAAPEWTIKGKYPWNQLKHMGPGPGAYSQYMKRPGSAYTMQGKRKEGHFEDNPGPGTYSLKHQYDHIGGYMGKKHKKGQKERSPGPGAYSLAGNRRSDDGWTFGMKLSDRFQILDFPGPGFYDGKKKFTVPLGKFGKANRSQKSTAYDSPGPGSYSYKSSLKDNGWTIQGKRKHKDSNDIGPGPWSYFPQINFGSPAYTIAGKHKTKTKRSDGPGPNTYFPSINATRPRPKSAKFSTGERDRRPMDNYPGPGDYKMKSTLGGPAYGIKGRPKSSYKSEGPGPGAYAYKTNYTKPRPASAKFGTAERMGGKKDSTPGPGQYQTWYHKDHRGGKIGSSTRAGTSRGRDGPGPGAYDLKTTLGQRPGTTMAGKRKQKSVDDTPGPGQYTWKLDGGPAYTLQGKYGRDYDLLEQLKKPGPSAYDPSYNLTRPHNPGKSMGMKYRAKYGEGAPGPGAYNFYDLLGKGDGWTMAHRPKTTESGISPGPAAYYPQMKGKGPAFTISGGHRQPYKSDLSPGPDQYNIGMDWNRGILMGKERRLQTAGEQSLVPGPGTYKLPENPGKGVYMAGRYPEKDLDNMPGPGYYDLNDKRGGPHYSMTGSRKHQTKDSGPGPAAYEIDRSYGTVYNSKPGVVFGKGTRPGGGSSDSPGPGHYYLPRPKTGGITHKWRHPQNLPERSPGPAAYDQKWRTIQNILDTQKPVQTMGGGSGINFYPKGEIPGPGTYYSPSKLDSRSVKFGTERRSSEKRNETPGPGYYYIPCTVADVPRYVLPVQDERFKWV